MSATPLSLLDLANVRPGERPAAAIERSVRLAVTADSLGFGRLWVSEHHNMPGLASAATAIYMQNLAAHTRNLRIGAGGVMLPNHAPLVVAEQFGLLATLYPGRIDLGLGRAPGTDADTLRALRRDGTESAAFASDILELHGYLTGHTLVPGVQSYPVAETGVPLYILGSSLFGARLAARLGLPYAFAAHFAPQALNAAADAYRTEFDSHHSLTGSGAQPWFIVAVNVIAADDAETAAGQRERAELEWIRGSLGRGMDVPDATLRQMRRHPAGQQVLTMLERTVSGSAAEVHAGLESLAAEVQADEVMVVNAAVEEQAQHRALELLAPLATTGPPVRVGTLP